MGRGATRMYDRHVQNCQRPNLILKMSKSVLRDCSLVEAVQMWVLEADAYSGALSSGHFCDIGDGVLIAATDNA